MPGARAALGFADVVVYLQAPQPPHALSSEAPRRAAPGRGRIVLRLLLVVCKSSGAARWDAETSSLSTAQARATIAWIFAPLACRNVWCRRLSARFFPAASRPLATASRYHSGTEEESRAAHRAPPRPRSEDDQQGGVRRVREKHEGTLRPWSGNHYEEFELTMWFVCDHLEL